MAGPQLYVAAHITANRSSFSQSVVRQRCFRDDVGGLPGAPPLLGCTATCFSAPTGSAVCRAAAGRCCHPRCLSRGPPGSRRRAARWGGVPQSFLAGLLQDTRGRSGWGVALFLTPVLGGTQISHEGAKTGTVCGPHDRLGKHWADATSLTYAYMNDN